MALTAFQQLVFQLLEANELGGKSAYQIIPPAPGGVSSWSFGIPQFDVGGSSKELFTNILLYSIDSSGNYIISPGDTQNRVNDAYIASLVNAASAHSATALSSANQALVNAALSSAYGVASVATATEDWIGKLTTFASNLTTFAEQSDQAFVTGKLAQLFFCDFANQYAVVRRRELQTFIQTKSANGFSASGALGIDSLLGFYFRTGFNKDSPWIGMQRFTNVVSLALPGGYVPANATEALGVLQAYSFAYLRNAAQFTTQAEVGDLNEFIAAVVEPCNSLLAPQLEAQYGVSIVADDGSVFFGYDNVSGSGATSALDGHTDTYNDVLVGGAGSYFIRAGSGNDLLIAGNGNQLLTAGSGADTLIGGQGLSGQSGVAGNDTLKGGSGYDTFMFAVPSSAKVTETIDDVAGKGQVEVVNNGAVVALGGSEDSPLAAVPDALNTWTDAAGTLYTFSPGSGQLSIKNGSVGTGNEILINNFNIDAAVAANVNGGSPTGYLGFYFQRTVSLTTGANNGVDPPPPDFIAGASQEYTAWINVASDAPQIVTITLSGAPSADFNFSSGLGLVGLTSEGTFTVTIPAGKTSTSFSLTNTAAVGGAATLQLTATLSDSSASVGAVSSIPVTQNYVIPAQDPFTEPTSTTLHYYGDLTAPAGSTSFGDTYGYYGFGEGGTLVSGTTGAHNYIIGGTPNSVINGNSGNDTVVADFGSLQTDGGVDVINGNGGQDAIMVPYRSDPYYWGNGIMAPDGPFSARIYANSEVDLATAIADANTESATGTQGDLIATNAPNATLVGGNGNDLILDGGDGVLVAGSGDDTLIGGAGFTEVTADWTQGPGANDRLKGVTWSAAFADGEMHVYGDSLYFGQFNTDGTPLYPPPPADYEGNLDNAGDALGVGNNTIFGGSGHDWIILSNGNNSVTLGKGDSTVLGGMGQSTIVGGEGDNIEVGGGGSEYIAAGSGDSLLVGRGGDNTLIGGSGTDTLVAGSQGADWATSESGDNYVAAGSGDALIFGAGGNDTLLGGAGNDTILAGAGNEYVVGGSGDDSIEGGAGNDTLAAGGDGHDSILAGSGNTTIFGGSGPDVIQGGSGANVIYAGNGGTADDPTRIQAGDGDSTIYGGDGIDSIWGGAGNDVIYAGAGGTADAPTQIIAGSGNTTIHGGIGVARIFGGAGANVLYSGDGGLAGNPTYVVAGTGATTLYGGAGVAVLTDSSGGSDLLIAGSGNTDLYGSGEDTLVAGTGSDFLSGSGDNTYVFGSNIGDDGIANTGSSGTVEFTADVSGSDVSFAPELTSTGVDLLVIAEGGGSITVNNGLTSGAVSSVTYDDSTAELSLVAAVQQAAALGNATNSVVSGTSGDLIFDTADGDLVQAGSGRDTISAWGNHDTLRAGAGGDLIYAEGHDDIAYAGGGDDTLVAMGANTTLVGGSGKTLFIVHDESDVVTAAPGDSGADTIHSFVSYILPDSVDVLTLEGTADLSATGNDDATNVITANDGDDVLQAGSGNDTLISGAGVDTLVTSFGVDVLYVNNSADVIETPYGAQYQDTIYSSVSYDLTAQIGNLVLTGSDALSAADHFGYATIVGNSGNDTLTAGSGADTIVSGSGISTLIAGSGYNTLIVNNAADVIQATSASSNVTVQSSVDFTLGQYLDTLNLIGSADLVGRGNNGASNYISGNSGNDTLIAGSGADTLVAGSGIDTLIAGSGNDVLQGRAGDTYELDSGFGNTKIETTSGSAVLRFGSGISANDLTLGITIDDAGAAALTISDGSGTATVSGGFTGSISSFHFANGDNLSLAQLLHTGTVISDSITGSVGDAVLTVGSNESIAGGFGNDTIIAIGSNDTLAAGTGNQDLLAFGDDNILTAGVGDDSLYGAGQDDVLATGTGNTAIRVGGTPATYSIAQGGTTTLDSTGANGAQTVLLPPGTSSADFTSFSDLNGDLVLQSLDGATTVVINGYYSNSALWLLKDSDGSTQSLDNWAGGPHTGQSSYRDEIDLLRQEFAASLPAVMNDIGLKQGSLAEPSQASSPDEYHFGGVSVQNATVSGGNLHVGSSDTDDLQIQTTTLGYITTSYQQPIYGYVTYPGTYVDIPVGSPALVRDTTDETPAGIPITDSTGRVVAYRYVTLPQTLYQQTGSNTVTHTSPVQSVYFTENQSFTDYNIVGDGGNDSITAGAHFAGTVQTGDGNVTVDLGGVGQTGGHPFYNAPDKLGVGAFVEAGDGNDAIYGTGGADILAAGKGFDTLVGALGSQFYVPLEGDSTDIIYAREAYYGSGPFPHNTLVLPNGITPADLSYVVFTDPAQTYGVNSRILQISYGDSSVLMYFDASPPNSIPGASYLQNAASDDTDGINRFQFSDGTVLSRAQVLAMTGTVQAIDSHNPQASLDIPDVVAHTATQAGSWFSGSDTNGGHVTWYQVTNSAASGGYFTLGGQIQVAGQSFLVSNDQLGSLLYFSGDADSTDEIQVSAFDGVTWGQSTTTAVHPVVGGHTFQATGPNQTITGSASGPDTLVGGYGGDTLVGASGSDTFQYNLGSGAEVVSEAAATTSASDNALQFGAGITAGSISLGMHSNELMLDLGNGDSVSIQGFDAYNPLGSLPIQRFKFPNGTELSVAELLNLVQSSNGSFTNTDGSVTSFNIGSGSYSVGTVTAENQPVANLSIQSDGTFDLLTYTFNGDGSHSVTHVHGSVDGSSESTLVQDYDSSGAIVSQTTSNADGSTDVTTFTHSADGSYTATDVHNPAGGGASSTLIQSFGPTSQGNPILSQSSLNTDGSRDDTTWTYDTDGSYVVAIVHTPSGGSGGSSLTQTYDSQGQILHEVSLNADGSTNDRTWTYATDGSSSMTDVYTPYGGGVGSTLTENRDSQGTLISQHALNSDGTTDDITYTSGANQAVTITDVHTSAGGSVAWTQTQVYVAFQLVSQNITNADGSSEDVAATYNADGSIVIVDVVTPAGGSGADTTTRYFNAQHQQTEEQFVRMDGFTSHTTFTWAADGSHSATTVSTPAGGGNSTTETDNYDSSNRIVGVHTTHGDGAVDDSTITYNSDGTSTGVAVITPGDGSSTSTVVTQYDAGGQVLAQNVNVLDASGSYSDQWSAQDGSHGNYWWNASLREYQEDWYNSDGSTWQDDYQYAAGGSPATGGVSFTETYQASDGSTGTRQFDASAGTTSLTWNSATTGAISGTTVDSGFVGLQHDDVLTNTQPDLTFFNPAVSSSFDAFLTAHS